MKDNRPVQKSMDRLRKELVVRTPPTLRDPAVINRWRDVRRVETFVSFPPPGHRSDLYGILDILAIGWGETLGVQCTTLKQFSAHRRKIEQEPMTVVLLEAGWQIELHGWHQPNGRLWDVRVHRFVLDEGGSPSGETESSA